MVQLLPVEVVAAISPLYSAATTIQQHVDGALMEKRERREGGRSKERSLPASPFPKTPPPPPFLSFPFLSLVASPPLLALTPPSPLSLAFPLHPWLPLHLAGSKPDCAMKRATSRKYTRPKKGGEDLTRTRSNWISSFYFSHSPSPLFYPRVSLFLFLLLPPSFLRGNDRPVKGKERRLDSRL